MSAEESATAVAEVRKWIAENPDHPGVELAEALASSLEMQSVWRLVPKNQGKRFLSSVYAALGDAERELARQQSPQEEAKGFEDVRHAARKLKQAIEASPLPRKSAVLLSVVDDGGPGIMWVGWRDKALGVPGCSIAMPEFLDQLIELVSEHEKGLPARAVQKRKGEETAKAGIALRWLYYRLKKGGFEFGHTNLAHIVRAAYPELQHVSDDTFKKQFVRTEEPFNWGAPTPLRGRKAAKRIR